MPSLEEGSPDPCAQGAGFGNVGLDAVRQRIAFERYEVDVAACFSGYTTATLNRFESMVAQGHEKREILKTSDVPARDDGEFFCGSSALFLPLYPLLVNAESVFCSSENGPQSNGQTHSLNLETCKLSQSNPRAYRLDLAAS